LVPVGSTSADVDGQVLENLDVSGCVTLNANNVTLRNVRIRCSSLYGVRVASGATGVLIEDVEIDGLGSTSTKGIVGTQLTARRVNVHSLLTAFVLQRQSAYEDSFVHDLVGDGSGILMSGGSNVTLRGNSLRVSQALDAVVEVRSAVQPIQDVLVEGNFLDGAGRAFSASGDGPGGASFPCSGVVVRKNRFGRASLNSSRAVGVSGFVWEDNVWDDTGEQIPR
jgi:hypothetical protein